MRRQQLCHRKSNQNSLKTFGGTTISVLEQKKYHYYFLWRGRQTRFLFASRRKSEETRSASVLPHISKEETQQTHCPSESVCPASCPHRLTWLAGQSLEAFLCLLPIIFQGLHEKKNSMFFFFCYFMWSLHNCHLLHMLLFFEINDMIFFKWQKFSILH